MRTCLTALLLLISLTLRIDLAHADKALAEQHSSQAQELLGTGAFAEAIVAYENAYAAYASPQFLYNIAQIQRNHLDLCAEALVSYRAFLAARPFRSDGLRRAETVALKYERILAARCPAAAPAITDPAPGDAPVVALAPTETASTDPLSIGKASRSDGDRDPYAIGKLATVLRVDGGGNQYRLGDIDIPMTGSIRASLGVPLGIEDFNLRALLSVATSPMRYRGSEEGVAYFVPVLLGLEFASANEGFAVLGALQVGGLGILGLAEGNPFTVDGKAKGASFTTALSARVGLDVPLHASWSAVLGLEASTSASPSDFAADVDTIVNLALSAGISRRL